MGWGGGENTFCRNDIQPQAQTSCNKQLLGCWGHLAPPTNLTGARRSLQHTYVSFGSFLYSKTPDRLTLPDRPTLPRWPQCKQVCEGTSFWPVTLGTNTPFHEGLPPGRRANVPSRESEHPSQAGLAGFGPVCIILYCIPNANGRETGKQGTRPQPDQSKHDRARDFAGAAHPVGEHRNETFGTTSGDPAPVAPRRSSASAVAS